MRRCRRPVTLDARRGGGDSGGGVRFFPRHAGEIRIRLVAHGERCDQRTRGVGHRVQPAGHGVVGDKAGDARVVPTNAAEWARLRCRRRLEEREACVGVLYGGSHY